MANGTGIINNIEFREQYMIITFIRSRTIPIHDHQEIPWLAHRVVEVHVCTLGVGHPHLKPTRRNANPQRFNLKFQLRTVKTWIQYALSGNVVDKRSNHQSGQAFRGAAIMGEIEQTLRGD